MLIGDSRPHSRRRAECSITPLAKIIGNGVHRHGSVPKIPRNQPRQTGEKTSRKRSIDEDDGTCLVPKKRKLYRYGIDETQSPEIVEWPGVRRSRRIAEVAKPNGISCKELHKSASIGAELPHKGRRTVNQKSQKRECGHGC